MTNRIVLLWCCAWIACLQLPPACASEERTVTAVPYLTANDLLEKFRLRRQFLLAARLFLNLPPASPHDHQHLLPLRQPGGERCESPVAALHGGRKPLDPRQEPLRETRLFPVAHGTTKTLFFRRFCRPTTTPQPSEGKVWYFAIIASQAIIEK